ncbi:MAG TPA: tetratricopeptide repeat protein [Verrucomicrobiae bacterium]|nr:tetratricopeptide repeat protein [Verrucomicrobiae bacterium]
MEATAATRRTRFGAYEVDLRAGEVYKHGIRLKLQDQPFHVLAVLLEHPGDVVTREELRQKLWPSDTFVDFDTGLNSAIKKLRDALSDSAEHPRFIETLPRRGYRFVAPVDGIAGEGQKEKAVLVPQESESQAAVGPSRRVLWLVVVAAACVLGVAGWAWRLLRSYPATPAVPPIHSLAVLPLQNLSGDPSQDYLADGMTEELIGRLANIHGLRVISRTSAMHFKNTQLSVPEIAKTLGVDAIVEGSVIREGNQVRVHAQLIRGASDDHIWAAEYQREYRSLLAVQEEVARTIAERIQISLTPQEQERLTLASAHPLDPETHEDYLKGRYYFNLRTQDALNKSIAFFQQAIARDPGYALAYSGLADTYAMLGFRGGFPSKDSLSRAKAAALKAIELDDTLAEPHASLAFIAETHEWDWATAEREYKRAVQLNPGDARAHHWYAGYLMYVGRFEEGISEERRARDLDPLSLPVNNALAGRLLVAGRVDEALEQLKKTMEMDPRFASTHQTLGWAYLNMGKHEEAIQEFEQALQLSGTDDTDRVVDLGFAYAAAGKREKARKILAKLMKLHHQGLVPSGSIAILYGALGEMDEAFVWLEKAYEERDPELTYIKVPHRRFEPLRHDPRYQDMLHRMGLPP